MNLHGRRARRVKVVDGRLQYGIIALFLAVVVAGLLLFSAVVAVIYVLAGGGDGKGGRTFIEGVLPWLLINDLAIMVLIIIVGVFATHRIAGPVYRIETDIDRALGGEKGVSIKLRRTDAFSGLARRVNQLIEHLERGPNS